MFSPYYARARSRGTADAEDHCAINVALYGRAGKRWAMTERGRRFTERRASEFVVGPSSLAWDGKALEIRFDEIGVPVPRRVHGIVRVRPQGLSRFVAALDPAGRHRWGPIAPACRVEVELEHPAAGWQGHGYLDSNEGDEPIDRPFVDWDWSRGLFADGSTAVIYDLRMKDGSERLIAQRFTSGGDSVPIEVPSRRSLPRTGWRIERSMRSEGEPRLRETLEDTPFYTRSLVESGLLGERVVSVHETLSLPRLVSLPVQWMLPWRMPRRA